MPPPASPSQRNLLELRMYDENPDEEESVAPPADLTEKRSRLMEALRKKPVQQEEEPNFFDLKRPSLGELGDNVEKKVKPND